MVDQDNRSVFRVALGLGGFVLVLAGMYYMSTLVNEVLLAAVLTLLMIPLSNWLQEHGMSKRWANLLIIVGVLVIAVALIVVIAFSLAGLAKDLPGYERGLDDTKTQIQTQLESLGMDGDSVSSGLTSASKKVLGIGASIAVNLIGYAANVVFILLIFAFMLFDAAGFRSRMQRAFSADHPTLSRIRNATTSVATYMRLLTYINLVIGIGDTILLWALGIPNPILWGFLAFLTGYIPYIGFWIAMIPVLILGYLQGGFTTALIVFIGYWLINGTLSNIVAPRVYGKGLNLSPVVTLVAVLFWAAILGSVGAMVAVPLTAIISSVFLVSYPDTEWLAILMREGDGSES